MTLGSTIRDAREAARISLESLSESTSIRMGLLLEMEENNFKHCGGDTYARGHLRNIGNRIGLNPQILIDLYNEEHSTEHRAMQDLLVENNIMQVPREARTISWKIPALVSVSILFVIAAVQIVTSNQSSTPTANPSGMLCRVMAKTNKTVLFQLVFTPSDFSIGSLKCRWGNH